MHEQPTPKNSTAKIISQLLTAIFSVSNPYPIAKFILVKNIAAIIDIAKVISVDVNSLLAFALKCEKVEPIITAVNTTV